MPHNIYLRVWGVLALVMLTAAVQPVEQVHIALGSSPAEMTVQWATPDPDTCAENTTTPFVEYGLSVDAMSQTTSGSSLVMQDQGDLKRNITVHTVFLKGLKAGSRYFYRAGSAKDGWSNVFSFKTLPADRSAPLTFAVFGDLGLTNGLSIPPLQNEAIKGTIDVVAHVGDFAYDLHDDEGRRGDQWMNAIEPIAANVPYMVCPGNHESGQAFNHYTHRFNGMPFKSSGGTRGNWFYSFDAGLVHFVSFSSEIYFSNPELIEEQYRWMEADLKKANMNRDARPWIIAMAHRPIYCSCDGDCDEDATTLRDGVKGKRKWGVEELFHKYGVDLFVVGHEHNYERLFPTYKFKVEKHDLNYYKNPTSLVQIVTGSAGCQENHEDFVRPIGKFSAYHTVNYGYSRMTIHNATHLYWEQVDVEEGSKVGGSAPEDYLWIEQANHGPHTAFAARHESVDSALFYAKGMSTPAPVATGGCPLGAMRGCEGAEGTCECIREHRSARGVLTCEWMSCSESVNPTGSIRGLMRESAHIVI